MTGAATAIEIRDLRVRLGRTDALAGVSLSIRRGGTYALLGRNGAGKSTLLRVLLGMLRPARGSVSLFGLDPWRSRTRRLARVGVVPETGDAPPDVSAADLCLFETRPGRGFDVAATTGRLASHGIPARQPFGTLSRGQQKLVHLALALGHRPDLLLLDDPTLGLDAVARGAVLQEVVGDIADRGTTVILATHDLAGVEGLADRVGILVEGGLVLDDDVAAVRQRFRQPGWTMQELPFPATSGK